MLTTSRRAATIRLVGTVVAVLMLGWVAPSSVEASCGDYLHYSQERHTIPQPPMEPCGCRGAECVPIPELPQLPLQITRLIVDESALLEMGTFPGLRRDRFHRPTSTRLPSSYQASLIDPPPRD